MATSVEILADSISPAGVRLVTMQCTFPRFILAEVNTHRAFSRNSASSRAIPPEIQIQKVLDDPFIPKFGSRVTGMGEGILDEQLQAKAQSHWLSARNFAVENAKALNTIGVDKSRINRLLEPFMWHTAIITATEFSNFFALRDNPAAQGEFQELAHMMKEVMFLSQPYDVRHGEWHLPLFSSVYEPHDWELAKKLSVSRCARVSYDKQHEEESVEKSLERYDRLLQSGHLSPFEHVATPWVGKVRCGNLRGWKSHRLEIPNESDFSLMQGE